MALLVAATAAVTWGLAAPFSWSGIESSAKLHLGYAIAGVIGAYFIWIFALGMAIRNSAGGW